VAEGRCDLVNRTRPGSAGKTALVNRIGSERRFLFGGVSEA